MKPRHKVSRAAIELIKAFEGFRQKSAALPDGSWTIGYGHHKTARAGAEVTEAEAELLLTYDLMAITEAVNDWTFTPLTQNQFDALVCFAFNVGLEGFRRSTVLRRINEGAMLQAACSFEMWRKADFEGERIVVDALVRRRAAEKALFLTPTQGWVPAPSPVLPPKVDYEVCASVPKDKPVALKTSLVGDTTTLVREDAPTDSDEAPVAESAPPSRLTEASEAVSARLQAVLPGEPVVAAPAPVAPADDLASPPPPPPETAQGAELQLFPFTPAPPPWPERIVAPESDVGPGEAEAAPLAATADLFSRPIYREADYEQAPATGDEFTAQEVKPVRFTALPTILLGLLGLAIFAAALVWGFNARSNGGLFSPVIVGAAMGVIGIGCIGAVVYSMLAKLGGHEE